MTVTLFFLCRTTAATAMTMFAKEMMFCKRSLFETLDTFDMTGGLDMTGAETVDSC